MTEPTTALPSANAPGPEAASSSTENHDVPIVNPTDPAADSVHQEATAQTAPGDIEPDSQAVEVKLTMLVSAELATRAANLAAKAGANLHQETQNLVAIYIRQQRHGLMMLIAFGSIVLTSCILFGWMSIRLQSRVVQLDAMLLAVGKRVVTMDDSIQAVAATGDILRDMSAKQDAISNQQARSDIRMEDVLKVLGETATSKPGDPQSADMLKLLQGIDARLRSQADAIKAIKSPSQSAPRVALDASAVRREVEAALRQQRQVQEAAAKANPPPASAGAAVPAAPAVSAKPRERLVQYPRTQAQGVTPEKQQGPDQ